MIEIVGTTNVDKLHGVDKASKRISYSMAINNKEVGMGLLLHGIYH